MSRVGKKPLIIPNGIKVTKKQDVLHIEGNNIVKTIPLRGEVSCNIEGNLITFKNLTEDKFARSLWGTMRNLTNQVIQGILNPFTIKVNLVGVGFKASVNGQVLNFQLGYSHDVNYTMPEGVTCKIEKMVTLIFGSADKQLLGQTVAEIQKFRPPEPYKGKGILIEGEFVLRKEGKTK